MAFFFFPYLDVAPTIEQDVAGFDITVDLVLAVDLIQAFDNLVGQPGDDPLIGHRTLLGYDILSTNESDAESTVLPMKA